VKPEARGRGIGHALLRGAESEVRRRQGRLLLVETSSTAEYRLARRLYEGSGYRLEAVVRDFYSPGDDLVIYAKDLVVADAQRPSAVPVESRIPDRRFSHPMPVAS